MKVTLKNGYKVMCVNWAFGTRQTWTLSMLLQNKRQNKRVGRMTVKDKVGSVSVTVAWRYSVLTLY
jgi:hypothetical protein